MTKGLTKSHFFLFYLSQCLPLACTPCILTWFIKEKEQREEEEKKDEGRREREGGWVDREGGGRGSTEVWKEG